MINVLLIEADNQKSLGGSCTRDIKNINNYLIVDGYNYTLRRQTMLLSIDNDIKIDKCDTGYLRDYDRHFNSFVNKVKKDDSVFIFISGHGYQKVSKEEKDNLDEYISFKSGIITDNILYQSLIEKLKDTSKRIVCLTDTCHSGTMFDLDEKSIYKRNIFSLSACLDSQLDSCDISNVGFGGSLTVHLLDIPKALYILLNNDESSIKSLVAKLTTKLKLLNQLPQFIII